MFYYFPDIAKFHGHWSLNRKHGERGRSFRPQIISPTPSKHISTIPKTRGELPYEEHMGCATSWGHIFKRKFRKGHDNF